MGIGGDEISEWTDPAVAAELAGYDHPRHILQATEEPGEKFLRSICIPMTLEENVEHPVLLFHHGSEVMKFTVDPNEGFVPMPVAARVWPLATHLADEAGAELAAPTADALARRGDAPLDQKPLNIPARSG
jgi:hypothetical protein